MKWLLRRILHRFGLDLRRWPQLIDFLCSRDIDVVLDVGANVGQFAIELRRAGYTGRIVSFEPVKAVYAELATAAAADPLWTTRNYALGSTEGTAEIHVSDYSVFSSIRTLNRRAAAKFNVLSNVARTETISVKPLDAIFSEFRDQRVFLKIDTQGFESDVLLGAESALSSILGVQLELPIEHLYKDSWTLTETVSFMTANNFVISQIRPNDSFLPDDVVSSLEIDVVFRRAAEAYEPDAGAPTPT